jgi:two-component system, cell cycle sensor histidine kinase and response regulator CckA
VSGFSDPVTAQLLELPRTALIGVDARGRVTLAANVEPLFGYRDDELIGCALDTLVTDTGSILAALCPDGGGPSPMAEIPCVRRNGTEFLADVSLSVVRAESGDQVWMAVREALEWHRAVVNRMLLTFIANSSSDAIISSTVDGTITYWNPAAERLYGYSAGEVVGQPVELLYDDAAQTEWARVRAALATGRSVHLDQVERLRKDGSRVRVTVSVTPILDADGTLIGVASVARDMGADERAQVRFRALLEAAAVPLIGVGPDGRMVMANGEAERLFGYAREELVGQPVELLVPEASQGMHAGYRADYLAAPRVRPMGAGLSLAARRKDGTEFPVDVSLAAIETDEGTMVAAAVRDLSQDAERDRLERQLQQVRRLESLGQLAGGVAHDFNNLMGVIDGYAAFILDEADNVDRRAYEEARQAIREDTQRIRDAVQRATHLTRQLLTFGRREVSRPQLMNPNAVVRDALALLERTLGDHISICTDLAPDLPPINADPGQMEQIIVNIAVNARDAMPSGGVLTVDTAAVPVDEYYADQRGITPGRYVRLRIADTGAGMTHEVADHAFEPFYTTKPTGQGTGLGLSTVYGIVARHDGDVALYSEPGHGTTLSILLPAARAAEPVPAAPPPVPEPAASTQRYTVLLVDDEEGLREVARRIMTRYGHHVLVAADGPEALALARDFPGRIDLLLTDVMMPKMLGKELADRLTAGRPDLRVLYMSGYAQPVLAAQGTLDPETALLEKPFTADSLHAALSAVLRT